MSRAKSRRKPHTTAVVGYYGDATIRPPDDDDDVENGKPYRKKTRNNYCETVVRRPVVGSVGFRSRLGANDDVDVEETAKRPGRVSFGFDNRRMFGRPFAV